MQFSGHIFYCYFFSMLQPRGRYISGGEERGREKEGREGGRESKLPLAEVFGLNSENDPFNSDGL